MLLYQNQFAHENSRVNELCKAGTSVSGFRRYSSAAAAFLVSLYIKDIWLGAQRPDTLLSHVRMVLDTAEDLGGGNEEAIVRLCRDIAATVPDI